VAGLRGGFDEHVHIIADADQTASRFGDRQLQVHCSHAGRNALRQLFLIGFQRFESIFGNGLVGGNGFDGDPPNGCRDISGK
jgi:hypothetical protein